MDKVILWGCGQAGGQAYEKLSNYYEIIAFGDNDPYKQNLIYKGIPVISFHEMREKHINDKIIVTIVNYYEVAKWLDDCKFQVVGYYDTIQEKVLPWQKISWKHISKKEKVRLYAGDIYTNFEQYPDDEVICLSLTNSNYRCIRHNITIPYPLEDNIIDSYQIEDVIEHIEKEKVVEILNEICRILRVGGYLRLSLPDYHSPLVLHNSFIDNTGKVIYDPNGGGKFIDGKVYDGGHLWFPTYEVVKELIDQSDFSTYKFYRYYDSNRRKYAEKIDYRMGYISRTKEHLSYKKDISIVVDCFK